jgi:hypothetical protein
LNTILIGVVMLEVLGLAVGMAGTLVSFPTLLDLEMKLYAMNLNVLGAYPLRAYNSLASFWRTCHF